MKTLILASSLIVLVLSSFVGLSIYYLNSNTANSVSEDRITINSVKITDPGIRCFTTPCFFRVINLNFTVTNSFERTINVSSDSLYSLHIIPDANHTEKLFSISNYKSQVSSVNTSDTLNAGTWNDNYTAILSLVRMLSSNEVFPTTLNVQLSLGDEIITSSVFSINLIL